MRRYVNFQIQSNRFPRFLSSKKEFSTKAELPEQADVVVVGGGSIGASTLYHLAEQGCNAVLIEKDQLTAGTTWHSAGLLWRLRPSDIDIQLIKHTRDLAKSLEETTGISTGWVENGGLFIADNAERLSEYQRLATVGKCFDIESSVLSPADTKELYPLINADDLYGSLYSPGDGTIDPSGWVSALIRQAKRKGAQVFENCAVKDILTTSTGYGKQVTGIKLDNGVEIKTKAVINCGGVWANKLAQMAGMDDIPLTAMHHAYVVTETIPGVPGLPNIRDHDASVYIKVQGDVFQVGGYENNPIFWDKVQDDFAFSLFDLDWEVFAQHIEGAVNRVPAIEHAGIRSTVCGPESFTPDHKALLGEVPGIRGFYMGCGFNSSGIMLAGGCGEQLAKWVLQGYPDLDMYSYDIARFHPSMTGNKTWTDEASHEAYAKNYAIVFPSDEPLAGRNMRMDPFFDEMVAAGCVFQFRHGYERPGFFTNSQAVEDVSVKPYDFYGSYGHERNQPYPYLSRIEGDNTFQWPASHGLVGGEVAACRDGVAVFNQSYFGKFFISGPDAAKAMDWICTNNIRKSIGSTIYTNMCLPNGGAKCDLTVSRIESTSSKEDRFYIAAGGGSATQDLEWIRKCIVDGGFDCRITDETDAHGMLSLQGRHSRSIMQAIAPATQFNNESFPFSTNQIIRIGRHDVRAIRLTFVGELGWELHIPLTACKDVYEIVMNAGKEYGIVNAGYHAIDSMSVEKGFKHWHEDLRSDDTPLEAGLGFICKLKSDIPFSGREALEDQKRNGLYKKLACFTLNEDIPLHGNEAIWRNGECVGYVRRCGYGHSVKKSIAYGYIHSSDNPLKNKHLKEGEYEIEVLNERRVPATFHPKCVFDPTHDRIQGIYGAEEY